MYTFEIRLIVVIKCVLNNLPLYLEGFILENRIKLKLYFKLIL